MKEQGLMKDQDLENNTVKTSDIITDTPANLNTSSSILTTIKEFFSDVGKGFAKFVTVKKFLSIIAVGALAVLLLFFESNNQHSELSSKTYFSFQTSDFFTYSGEVGIGESASINPVITSNATVDMYVFIKVEMPAFGSGGLYTIIPDSNWSLVETEIVDGKCIEIFRYDEALPPDQSTTPLSDCMTMVNMTFSQYAALTDINVDMRGYACGTDGETLDTAWDAIKDHFGL